MGRGCDPVRAAAIPRQEVLRTLHFDVVAERGAEQLQLGATEVLARARGHTDRTVVLDEDERAVAVLDHLGQIALVGPDAGERLDAGAEAAPSGDDGAVGRELGLGARVDDLVETRFAERTRAAPRGGRR